MYAGIIGLIIQLFLTKKASANFVRFIMLGFCCLGVGFFGMAQVTSLSMLIMFLAIFAISFKFSQI